MPDRLLAVALTLYERSLCPCGCGFPRSKAWDSEMDGWFEGRAQVCFAKAAAEKWRADPDNKDAAQGSLVYVVDTRDEESVPPGSADGADHEQHEAG